MKTFRLNFFYLSIFILLITATTVRANQVYVIKDGFNHKNMFLLGSARKKFLTFRVVTVDLYIAKGYQSSDVLADIPKRIEVNYHVKIPKKELDQATIKGIKQNFSQKQLALLMPQIKQMNSYYRDVGPGDQITITYVPGLGSQVLINKEVKGVVPGSDFAKAFFSIWVGEHPVDKRAKYKLLGKMNS